MHQSMSLVASGARPVPAPTRLGASSA
jgi:hypothetical protein